MKTRLLTLLILLVTTFSSEGQTWINAYSIGSTTTSLNDKSYGACTDAAGNKYFAGNFTGTSDFDPGSGTNNLVSSGSTSSLYNCYLTKYDQAGGYQYAVKFGLTANYSSMNLGSICTDGTYVYVYGAYQGVATFGSYTFTAGTSEFNLFICKFLAADGSVVWAQSYGGSNIDFPFSICNDNSGGLYINGYFNASTTLGAYNLTAYITEGFTAKVSADDGSVTWAKTYGTTNGYSEGQNGAMVYAPSVNKVYSMCMANGAAHDHGVYGDFTYYMDTAGNDAVVLEMDPGTGHIDNATFYSSTYGNDNIYGACYDAATGDVFITGSFETTLTLPGLSALPPSNGFSSSLLVARYSTTVHNFVWAQSVSTNTSPVQSGIKNAYRTITADHKGHIYAGGSFYGTVTVAGETFTSAAICDMLVTGFDAYTGDIRWSEHIDDGTGPGNNNVFTGVAVDSDGKMGISGFNTAPNVMFGSILLPYLNYYDNLFAFMDVPLVKTSIGTDLTSSSVTLNGDAVNGGGNAITGRGIIYGSDSSLVIGSGTTVSLASGAGTFSLSLSGLTASTKYYARTYITTSRGTFYGTIEHFTTLVPSVPPVITLAPAAHAVCVGNTTTFTAASTDPSATYEWEYYDGNFWQLVTDGAVFSGATTNTISVTSTAAMNGWYFRTNAVNGAGSSGFTPYVPLTVDLTGPVNTLTGANKIAVGAVTSLTGSATGGIWGSGSPSIATVSTTGAVGGASLGQAIISYTLTNACGSATDTQMMNVIPSAPPTITVAPAAHAVCVGNATTFTAASTDPSATYEWEYYDGTFWQLVTDGALFSGATTNTIGMTSTAGMNGWYFRTNAVNGAGSSGFTPYVQLTVDIAPPVPAISGATEVAVGRVATLAGGGAGTSPVWESANTSFATVNNSGVVYGVDLGNVAISYTLTNGCGSATVTHTMNVIPANMVPIFVTETPALALCMNSPAADIASLLHVNDTNVAQTLSWSQVGTPDRGGTLSFTWETAVAGHMDIAPGGSITYLPAADVTGNETLKIRVTDGQASDTISIVVTVYPYPTVSISGADTACTGSSTGLTANGAATYVWGAAPGLSSTTGAAVATLPAFTTTYTVTGTTNGCSDTAMHTITTIARPVINDVSSQVICNGASTDLVNFSGTATYYTWVNTNAAIGLAASGIGNISVFTGVNIGTSPVSGLVTVTPNNNFCAGISTTLSMTIKPTPTVNAISGQTVCNTQTITNIGFTGAVTGTNYTWTNTNSTIGVAAAGSGNISSFAGVNTGSVIETATVTVTPEAASCVGTSRDIVLTVNPTPYMHTLADQQICNGFPTTAVIFGSDVAGATYNWTNTNALIGLALFGSTPSIPSFPAANSSTSTLVATVVVAPAANGCTGVADTFTYTVTPTPTVNAVSGQILCNTDTTTAINFTGAVTGTVYNWSNTNAGVGLATTGTGNIASFIATNSGNIFDTATITVIPAIGTCSGVAGSLQIIVKPTPTVNAITNQVLCNTAATTAVTFTGAVAGTANTWVNTNTNIGLAANGLGNIASFTATNTTTAPILGSVTVTPASNGCIGSARSFTYNVNPTPRLTTALTGTVCSGAPYNYPPNSATAGVSYAWTRAAAAGISNTAGSGSGSVSETLYNTTLASKTATYHYTLTANGCSNPQSVVVTVNPAPSAPVIAVRPPANVCSQTLNQNFGAATNAPDSVQYTWTATGATVYAEGAGHRNSIVNFPSAGNASIVLTANAAGFTCYSRDTFKVTVSNATTMNPEIYYVHDHFVCIDNTVESYQWGYDDATTLDSVIYTGQVDQNLYLPLPDYGGKKYWVMTSKEGCASKVYYNAPTGVMEVNNMTKVIINVFPNPASSNVVVEIEGVSGGSNKAELADMTGKVITQQDVDNNKTVLNVNDLAPGVYIVSVYHNGAKAGTAKLVKN